MNQVDTQWGVGMAPSVYRLCYELAGRGTGFRFPEDYKSFVVALQQPDRQWVPPPSSPVDTGCSLIVDKPCISSVIQGKKA
jgi:hypothetical protein